MAAHNVGDILSERPQYYIVRGVAADGSELNVEDTTGKALSITKDIVDDAMQSADFFEETRKASKTDLAELLAEAGSHVFTVCFYTQPSMATMKPLLEKYLGNPPQTAKEFKATMQSMMHGKLRTLRGRLANTEPIMGRSSVVDLDIHFNDPGAHALRLVDHRHIQWLILRGIKYEL